jgi:hypothetical protein
MKAEGGDQAEIIELTAAQYRLPVSSMALFEMRSRREIRSERDNAEMAK